MISRLLMLFLSFSFILSLPGCKNSDKENSGENSDMQQQLTKEERLEWFKHDKFGLFIHWGPYSMLGAEWKDQRLEVGVIAEWIMKKMEIPVKAYREMAHDFNPVKFDAEEWVRLAKNAGMKYLVITAKHHDGFAMYHSQVSEYNIVDWTPFDRDPLKELSEACRKAGIRFCFYYSHREDWNHPDAYGNDWDFDPEEKDFEKYLEEKSKPQLRELLTNYGPIGLVWFDRGLYTQQQAREFVNIVRELRPRTIINGRVGNYEKELMGDYQNMNDNGMPIGGMEEYWETPQTLNESWGYHKFDHNWKSPTEVIRRLVEIVSKGGNYLLNIGPTGEGLIPQPSVEILTRVGEWMQKNQESIYGTTASPFPPLEWGGCTVKDEKLYLHVFDWPENQRLHVKGLHNRVKNVYPLVNPEQKLSYEKNAADLILTLPQEPIDQACSVIVVEIDGKPDVEPVILVQQDDGSLNLDYIQAITGGKTVKRFNRKGLFHISKWTQPDDYIAWNLRIDQPGKFNVLITYAAQKEWEGADYYVKAGSEKLKATVEHTGDWYDYKTSSIGTVDLQKGGEYSLKIYPANALDHFLMYFKEIKLVPVSG